MFILFVYLSIGLRIRYSDYNLFCLFLNGQLEKVYDLNQLNKFCSLMDSGILCGFPSKWSFFILKLKELWGDSLIVLKNIEISDLFFWLLSEKQRIWLLCKNKCSWIRIEENHALVKFWDRIQENLFFVCYHSNFCQAKVSST